MGDFHQNGSITTLHNLNYSTLEYLEKKLVKYSKRRKMGLIIPALYSELEKPALQHIVDVLKDVPYITEITIGLDQATKEQFEHAKKYFAVLNTDVCRSFAICLKKTRFSWEVPAKAVMYGCALVI